MALLFYIHAKSFVKKFQKKQEILSSLNKALFEIFNGTNKALFRETKKSFFGSKSLRCKHGWNKPFVPKSSLTSNRFRGAGRN